MNASMLLSLFLVMTLLTTGLTAAMPKDGSRRAALASELSAEMRDVNVKAPARRQALGCYCYRIYGTEICRDYSLDDAGNVVVTDVASC